MKVFETVTKITSKVSGKSRLIPVVTKSLTVTQNTEINA